MSRPPVKSLGELFDEVESDLDRQARERREAEEAHAKTPEGIAAREAYLERLRQQEAELPDEEPDADEETDEDEDEEERDE